MTTKRRQVSMWLQEDEYQLLKQWADADQRKISAAARIIIMDRLKGARPSDPRSGAKQAATPEGCAAV